MLEFRVLGPLEVCRDGQPVALPGIASRRVLAALALRAGEWVSVERLIDEVWGERPPGSARKALQMHVSRLRHAFGTGDAVVESRPGAYRLAVAADQVDAGRFAQLAAAGRRESDVAHARELLVEALALWRGPALSGLDVSSSEAARLEEERLAALEARIEAELATGRHGDVIGELQELAAAHPLRERLHAQLMLALYRCGRQADALSVYRRVRAGFVEELGIEPGASLRELEQRILTQDAALDPSRAEPSPPPSQLPLPPTTTIGREAEIAAVRALLATPDVRLITLAGAGGVGKTRLAIEVARAIATDRRDGTWFISLASTENHEDVASTIAQRLGVTLAPRESLEAGLARHLHQRELLLVLDNFEHVLDAAALVADLLAASPGLQVLATSRAPLQLRAERLFRVAPLEAEAAAALLVAAATARDPSVEFSERDAEAIGELCRRLDGLPLAIELAAGRLGLLSAPELAAQLRVGLDVLGSSTRDAPARQRTLVATLEWSYQLLAPDEQRALAALACFAGGCTVDAAQAVTGATLDVLQALVANNLVLAGGGTRRLGLLETVREFARANLRERPDADDIRARHYDYYLELAERAQRELRRSSSPAVTAEVGREVNNLRAALGWALERPTATLALRLATALNAYWSQRGEDAELRRWLRAALAASDENVPAATRAAALHAYSYALGDPATVDRSEAVARESLALWRELGDPAGISAALVALARSAMLMHRREEAYEYACHAEELALEAGDELARIDAVHTMAMMAPTIEDALALGERAAAAHRANANRRRLAMLQTSLTYTALVYRDHAVARRLSDEAVHVAEELGDPMVRAFAYGNAALVELLAGDAPSAAASFARQLVLVQRYGYTWAIFEPLNGMAAVAAADSDDELAARLSGAADVASPDRQAPEIAQELEARYLTPARSRLGAARWESEYAAGATLTVEQATGIALRAALAVPSALAS